MLIKDLMEFENFPQYVWVKIRAEGNGLNKLLKDAEEDSSRFYLIKNEKPGSYILFSESKGALFNIVFKIRCKLYDTENGKICYD